MRAAVYARKSTEQNGAVDESKSVARQVEHARAYAERKGWTVVDEHVYIDDGISGAEFTNRPGFVRLMESLKPRPLFDVLVLSEESRLGREYIQTLAAMQQIVMAGVRVFCYLTDSEQVLDNTMRKAMLGFQALADELERERARQRTYDALARKARAGHVVGGRCYGYRNVDVMGPEDASGRRARQYVKREIVPAEADTIRIIFDRFATFGWGLPRIAKALNTEGRPAPRSQRGRPSGWAPSSVREALRRPLYRGEIVWNQSRKRTAHGIVRQRPRPESEWMHIPAPDLRIVDDATWFAAQARFRTPATPALAGPKNAKYLLVGLMRCACGSGFEVLSWKSGRGRKYQYGCAAHRRKGASICANSLRMPLAVAEDAVLRSVATYLLEPSIVHDAIERALAELAPDERQTKTVALEAELTQVRAELARLADAVASAGGEVSALVQAIQTREARRCELESQIRAERQPVIQFDRQAVRRALSTQLRDWRSQIRGTPETSRLALKALIADRLTFTPVLDADEPYYRFEGAGTIEPILGRVRIGDFTLPRFPVGTPAFANRSLRSQLRLGEPGRHAMTLVLAVTGVDSIRMLTDRPLSGTGDLSVPWDANFTRSATCRCSAQRQAVADVSPDAMLKNDIYPVRQ